MRAEALFRFRYLVTLLVFLSSSVTYMNRTHISIAIVDMVDNQQQKDVVTNSSASVVYCKRSKVPGLEEHHEVDGHAAANVRYEWSQSTQGQVLGSFYYSYIVFQMPTGVLTEKYGGRWIIAVCLMGSGIISLVTPIVASLHVGALIGLRVLLGIIQAGMFPAGFGLLCQWMPVSERSTAFALLNTGGTIGSSIPAFISGPLINKYGWPSMFYIPGIVSVVMAIVFALLVRSKPEEHPFVSTSELKIIREGSDCSQTGDETAAASTVTIPWNKILTNKSVLSVAFYQFSTFWVLTIWGTSLPKYLDEILAFDINANGLINGVLQWLQVIPLTMFGFISEIIIQKNWMTRTNTRKVFSLLTGAAAGVCLLLVPAAGCNQTPLIVIIFIGSFMCGFTSASDTPIPSEMTSNFPAAVFAFLNMVSTAAGFVTPAFVGAILQGMPNAWDAWSIVFYASGALMIVSNIFFLIFASAQRQSFDYVSR